MKGVAGRENAVDVIAVILELAAVFLLEIVFLGEDDEVVLGDEEDVEKEEGPPIGKHDKETGKHQNIADVKGVADDGIDTGTVEIIGPEVILATGGAGVGEPHRHDADEFTEKGDCQASPDEEGVGGAIGLGAEKKKHRSHYR